MKKEGDDGLTAEYSVKLMEKLEEHEEELFEAKLTEDSLELEVAQFVAGYVAKKLIKNNCVDCLPNLIEESSPVENSTLLLRQNTSISLLPTIMFESLQNLPSRNMLQMKKSHVKFISKITDRKKLQ